jgi:hypothetical protein
MNPVNQCANCTADFCSLAAFDEHILSAAADPTFECMTVAEMIDKGWTQDKRGRWTSPRTRAKAEKYAEHFDRAA